MSYCSSLLITHPNHSRTYVGVETSKIADVINQNFAPRSYVHVKVKKDDQNVPTHTQNGVVEKTENNSGCGLKIDDLKNEVRQLKEETKELISFLLNSTKRDLKNHLDKKFNWVTQKLETNKSQLTEQITESRYIVERNIIDHLAINSCIDEAIIQEKNDEITILKTKLENITNERNKIASEMETQHGRIAKLSSTITNMEEDLVTFCTQFRRAQSYNRRVNDDEFEDLYDQLEKNLTIHSDVAEKLERDYALQYGLTPKGFINKLTSGCEDSDRDAGTLLSDLLMEMESEDEVGGQVNKPEQDDDTSSSFCCSCCDA